MNTKSKNLVGALSGNFLEYYDVTLYAFFASILAPVFFPAENPFVSKVLALGAFAIGFLARPFGGIFFGYLGDRFGRKMALSFSVLLVTVPTFSIGLIPSYDRIGIMAPLLVTLCRLMQGISTGGEYSGVAVFVSENSSSLKKSAFLQYGAGFQPFRCHYGYSYWSSFYDGHHADLGMAFTFLYGRRSRHYRLFPASRNL